MEFLVQTPDDFGAVIECVLGHSGEVLSGATLITLTGDLGAGKTTFTQQLAAHLGVAAPVTSPTFGIMKAYELPEQVPAGGEEPAGPGGEKPVAFRRLVHIDAYRLESVDEAGPLRLSEVFADPTNLVCLEWPERIADILPPDRIDVTITIGEREERQVVVRG